MRDNDRRDVAAERDEFASIAAGALSVALIGTRRGLAFSAIGMRRVSTPAS